MKVNIIGEIGINHNGCIDLAKKIIDVACVAGCDFVKFHVCPASHNNLPIILRPLL